MRKRTPVLGATDLSPTRHQRKRNTRKRETQPRRNPLLDKASSLLWALNGDSAFQGRRKGSVDAASLADLIHALKKIEDLKNVSSPENALAESRQLSECIEKATRALGQCAATPTILSDNFSDDLWAWNLYWIRSDTKTPLLQMEMALLIVDIAKNGNISKLSTCEHCRRWFFKRKELQKYCSERYEPKTSRWVSMKRFDQDKQRWVADTCKQAFEQTDDFKNQNAQKARFNRNPQDRRAYEKWQENIAPGPRLVTPIRHKLSKSNSQTA